ncbi:efflux RND transporter permease subunit [Colwellia sp. 4_MG-2023]|uniref:efflux RND transporter permease subunit n=1 Tax=unclassified Colwellia TaxID=196834 RepID=UPI001C08A841|nr:MULTISPECIES: efflux RND transporter permease subunit [unclassified Colwellia]MBU2924956.1 efflux RND transporter permease subunit [Colwellia sp. C2M11]MDO6506855.1 efflux RND transporter permease subunit [Colwellia sp. 5_MG-2023]MDO6555770.1 efflux RND transporter permease subunit [Colwellia sp. 4_MG-2023]MDO6652811.1 efflux RND transporter permease subunit [Colwellia sp. 3_MG-2023]MDO6665814.1 efflux RND transporter permease subunit [Colwellia sp. 2_MG-2023]
MKLPNLAIKNAQFTLTIVVLLVLVGIVSYLNMPRSEDPQFDIPITLIEVIYPGASPTDIETLVVDPLEEEFADIENIKQVEAQIKNDGARIEVKFQYGADPELAFNKIQLAVSSVKPSLPAGVQDLLVLKATPTAVAVVQLALWTEPADYKQMEFYAKLLEKRLETISSVKKADIWGYPQQIMAVDLNLDLLLHHKISTTQVMQVLQGRAINITPGFVDANTRRFNVKTSGNFEKISQLEDTIILSNDDFVLRLKDIAKISFGSQDPSYLAYYDNKPVIFVTVEQRMNTNIFSLTQAIQQEIALFKETVPPELKMEVLFEQAHSVENRVNGFFENLWQGLVLVGILSLLFLGLREALVVMIAIPLSFVIAIGWLDFAGFGLQQMSIVGLIIALGLLVDNAIVVTESIHRERKKHTSLTQAAAAGASKVGWAVSSGTITTMLAFLPMLMLASDTGDFIRSMPVTVVLVLLASLLIALTFTPLLASKFLLPHEDETASENTKRKIKTLQHYINNFAENFYVTWLQKLFHLKVVVIAVAIASLIAMLSLFSEVGLSLFPKAEKPMILIDVETPPNSSLEHTNNVMQKMTHFIEDQELVEKVALNVGSSNPRIYYNEIPKRGVVKYGQILVVLTEFDPDAVEDLVSTLRTEFDRWQQAKITIKEFTQGPVTDQPIAIRLISESLADLERVAKDLESKMAKTEGTINIDNPIGVANTELNLQIDYEKAGLSNIDVNTLDNTLQSVLSGTYVGRFNDDNGENYPILVRNKNPDINTLSDVYVTSLTGQQIPLMQVVDAKLQKGQTDYFHYQKLRMAKVSADAAPGYSVNALTEEFVQYIEQYDLPLGMYYILGGEEESRQESFSGLTQIMLITAIGIFAVLVLQFKSFLQPLIIFSSIPFAMAGSVIGLYLTGLSFSMMAFIGLISLFGIVVNNAIILIDSANRNLAEGLNKQESVLKASATRFTPILLTTLTTIGGLIPLTLYGGGLWQPLGVVLISGLCVSAISSFILVPVLTELFTRSNVSSFIDQEIKN